MTTEMNPTANTTADENIEIILPDTIEIRMVDGEPTFTLTEDQARALMADLIHQLGA